MSTGEEVLKRLRAAAQSARDRTGQHAPTQELFTRHLLESFLHRLSRTEHAQDFVLKGGILLAVYDARRPTKGIDANAISADVTPEHLATVVRGIAAAETDDGVTFRPETTTIREIRDQIDYPGGRHLVGSGAVGQAKWAAWIRKQQLEPVSEEYLDDQVALVAQILDSAFAPAAT